MIVDGPGLVDLAYWRQDRSFAVHLVNYNNPMTMPGAYREIIPAGPYAVSLELPAGAEVDRSHSSRAGSRPSGTRTAGELPFRCPKSRFMRWSQSTLSDRPAVFMHGRTNIRSPRAG